MWRRLRRRSDPPRGGERAHHAAQMNLQEQISKWPDVLEVSESMRELRQRNHFAEQIQQVFGGNR